MQEAAKEKAAVTKKMNLLAGAKLSLPGQNRGREHLLRTEFTAFIKPADFAEMLWIIDMARCQAAIEVLGAQIAAVRMRQVKEAYRKLGANQLNVAMRLPGEEMDMAAFLAVAQLDVYAEQNFTAPWNKTFLADSAFADLLAATDRKEIEELRMLQQSLHSETRERDRLLNQLKRRRSQDLRDALLISEEKRQAALFAMIMAEAAAGGEVPRQVEVAALPEPALSSLSAQTPA